MARWEDDADRLADRERDAAGPVGGITSPVICVVIDAASRIMSAARPTLNAGPVGRGCRSRRRRRRRNASPCAWRMSAALRAAGGVRRAGCRPGRKGRGGSVGRSLGVGDRGSRGAGGDLAGHRVAAVERARRRPASASRLSNIRLIWLWRVVSVLMACFGRLPLRAWPRRLPRCRRGRLAHRRDRRYRFRACRADDAPGLDQIAAVGDGEAELRVLLDEEEADAGLPDLASDWKSSCASIGERPSEGSSRSRIPAPTSWRGRSRPSAARRRSWCARSGEALVRRGKQRRRDRGCASRCARALRIGAEQQILAHRQVAEDAASFRHQRDAGLDDLMRRQHAEIAAAERDPAAGQARTMPAMTLSSVVLPAPLAPRMTTISPRSTLNVDVGSARWCLP